MNNYIYRTAELKDISFLVEAIIQAEKSGTDILSYTTLFGLSESKARVLLADMLEEEVEDCDLALSGFMIAEYEGYPVATLNAWLEGKDGLPSTTIKGNLLSFYLPKEAIVKAQSLNELFSDLSIEHISGSLCFGPAYVVPEHEGALLLVKLCQLQIRKHSDALEAYCPIFSNNLSSIQNFKLQNFKVFKEYISHNEEIKNLLPSNKKLLMYKKL